MDTDDDDPEERRRKTEAKAAAQNLGAVIGLVAGAALAIGQDNNIKEAGAPETNAPTWEQSMG